MATTARIARVRQTHSASGDYREWKIEADAQDYAAGAKVTLTFTQLTSGGLPPPQPDSALRVWMRDDDASTIGSNTDAIRIVDLPFATTLTTIEFWLTHDATSTGSPRSGTFEIGLRVQNSTVGTAYNLESDGNPSANTAGYVGEADRGWVRASTTATLTPSGTDIAYGESTTLTVDVAAPALNAKTLTLAVGPDSGASSSTTDGHSRTVACDNTFPAASTVYTPSVTVPNSPLTGQPWTVLTVTTQDVTVDPRITVDHHMQKNNNTFDANLDVSSRLTSDLGFVGFTLRNAKGAVVPSITCTETLTDEAGLVAAAVNRSVVSDANGRPPTLASWDSQLPGGGWVHTVTITSPSTATGLEQGNQATFTLLAASPSMKVVAEGGPPLSSRAKHFDGTGQFQTFVGVIDVDTQEVLSTATTPAVSTADVALFRVNPSGVAQYLNASGAWANLTPGVPIDFHAVSETAAGSGVFVKTFVADDTWGTSDVVVLGRAVVAGTPYGGLGKEIAVGGSNGHDGYAFDVLAAAGFPQR